MNRKDEVSHKENAVRQFLRTTNSNGVLLTYQRNFSWFTAGGENRVIIAATEGASSLLVTQKKTYLLANNIETPRLLAEEVGGLELEIAEFPWDQPEKKKELISQICPDNLSSDDGFSGTKQVDITPLQFTLTEREVAHYRILGKDVSRVVNITCREIQQGDTEDRVAANLAKKLIEKSILPTVILIAADERISKFRHPIPKNKAIKNYVMVATCAKRKGLIASMTRIVHFGKIPVSLTKKHEAVKKVNTALILNTQIGKSIGQTFIESIKIYAATGFPDEWKLHHQGGPMGYKERYFLANSATEEKAHVNQAFGWNPSITGTKTEDTTILTENGPAIVTEDADWPMTPVEYKGKTIMQPNILVK